jgi:hypothetical protein
MEELGRRLRCWRKIPKKVGEKMLEQFSTTIPMFSTFHKNVERILKKEKNIVQYF